MTPAISIVIPYFRGRELLREAVESVRAQSTPDWELVVVDDAGPEPADRLIAAYADPRIRYRRNDRTLGLAGNWNACVAVATAPLVTLLHQDDRLLPQYAERMIAAAGRHRGIAAFFADVRVIDAHGRPSSTPADRAKRLARRPAGADLLVGDRGLAAVLSVNYIYCPSLCLVREVVGAEPFDTSLSFVTDLAFTSGQLLAGQRLLGIREVLFEYRRHPASETEQRSADSSRFVEELDFYRRMEGTCAARGWTRSRAAARRRLMVRGHLLQRLLADLAGRRRAAARDKAALLWRDLRN